MPSVCGLSVHLSSARFVLYSIHSVCNWIGITRSSLLSLCLAACAASPQQEESVPEPPAAELTLLPESKPVEELSSPETESLDAQAPPAAEPEQGSAVSAAEPALDENGSYDSKEDVALYLHLYGHLPGNYITKKEAQSLGWSGGSLEPYAPGKCIGGSRFGNYEGRLPDARGRSWTECDIDTLGKKSRGARRIVFSNDGLIYYTDDHYESFTLLYGEE